MPTRTARPARLTAADRKAEAAFSAAALRAAALREVHFNDGVAHERARLEADHKHRMALRAEDILGAAAQSFEAISRAILAAIAHIEKAR